MTEILELITNTETAILTYIQDYGTLTYLILFLIIFCETGLIITPFFPGDGLLLTVGVISATGSLNILWLTPLLIIAAILGNVVNFFVGRYIGERIMKTKNKYFHKYINNSHDFFEKHGDMAVMVSRFFPIVRTYVPFVAGLSAMSFKLFNKFNLIGAILWVLIFTVGGYFIGGIPILRENFVLIFSIVMILTVIPFLYKLVTSLFKLKKV
ncbi:MAG: VTT domain-containing protein [Bacteroidetes bacterium]|jgi:membrane-associated protein|nr:VTT domain-containing protein [Bacteroidota bacterium]MDF1865521.1 VTT domain-containing protein [Saprospiraceae bacterium]